MEIRIATRDDIEELIRVRHAFRTDLSPHSDEENQALDAQFRTYLQTKIESGQFVGVLGEVGIDVACAAFLLVEDCPATRELPRGRFGKIINVYTYPQYRRQGYATEILEQIIAKARVLDLDAIELEATNIGQTVYERVGFSVREFVPMRLVL